MKVVFLSNYFNHHQKPFSDAMYKRLGDDYLFIETDEMGEFRKKLGYEMESLPSYVIPKEITDANADEIKKIINDADVLITGSVEEKYFKERKKQKKLIFRYSEKLFRKGREPLKYIPRFIKYQWQNRQRNIYLLSVGKFAAKDYKKLGLFRKKAFKWAYFPATVKYDNIDELISQKKEHSILWVGRFLKLKHPEVCYEIARRLKDDGYSFTIDLIGTIKRPETLNEWAERMDVVEEVKYLGAMKPEEVRAHMEKSEMHLFTSDEKEGWGAVVNEAMNSACVVFASDAAGATSYLIEDGVNGFSYKSGNIDELYSKVKRIFDDKDLSKSLSKRAYETMCNQWDANVAAERFIALVNSILNKESTDIFKDGPCSPA